MLDAFAYDRSRILKHAGSMFTDAQLADMAATDQNMRRARQQYKAPAKSESYMQQAAPTRRDVDNVSTLKAVSFDVDPTMEWNAANEADKNYYDEADLRDNVQEQVRAGDVSGISDAEYNLQQFNDTQQDQQNRQQRNYGDTFHW